MLIGIFRQINMQDNIFLVLVPAIAVIVFYTDVRFVVLFFFVSLSRAKIKIWKINFGKI
jgi:hypothetical protein